jgi:hypothetical protein
MVPKKDKTPRQGKAEIVKAEVTGISRTGKKIIGAGLIVLVCGYFVLSRTDAAGQNFASLLSPFLILGGYAIIGLGIIYPSSLKK